MNVLTMTLMIMNSKSRTQLFRERLSKRRVTAFATMPKGSMGDIK